MKKLLLIIAISFLACDKDDDTPQIPLAYGVDISASCPGGTVKSYCINKDTHDRIQSNIVAGESCQRINFQSTDGIQRSGYLRSVGTGCSQN